MLAYNNFTAIASIVLKLFSMQILLTIMYKHKNDVLNAFLLSEFETKSRLSHLKV